MINFSILRRFAIISAGGIFMLTMTPSPADEIDIYPKPQQIAIQSGQLKGQGINVQNTSSDKDSEQVLTNSFHVNTNGIPLTMGLKNDPRLADFAQNIPDREGAYKLTVSPEKITLVGHDNTGLFYAVQTLVQLAKISEKGTIEFPIATITDWPDMRFRGTVEGFYGRPWSFEDRVSQFKFYGKYKLNTYIYGPKDDPYHGFSNKWREPYPTAQAEKLKELVKVAKENKVNFVWAMHPGRDITWGEADRKAALNKFEMMYALGFRSFGVFFDDIGGTAGQPEGQVEFLNYLNREFVHKKPDVTPLLMCPTQYWGGGGKYHQILGQGLDKDIDIMWTGNAIVGDITKAGLDSINSHTGRKAYVWWNFPVIDYVPHYLLLGRVYGIDKGTTNDMSGFVSNPMDKPEASKIALFSVADFTWNQKAYDSSTSWKRAIKTLFPKSFEAVQTLADHNSDAGPSYHNYRREESVDIQPTTAKVIQAAQEGIKISDLPETTALADEFKKIKWVEATIRESSDNPVFIDEIDPWLSAFGLTGEAGSNALEAVKSLEQNKPEQTLEKALFAADNLVAITKINRKNAELEGKKNADRYPKEVKVGYQVITPTVKELLNIATSSAISGISGRPSDMKRPYISSKQLDGFEKMLDDNPTSFYHCREPLKKDDYFGMDLGNSREINNVHIVMGRKDGDHQAIYKGQLEISNDGTTWTPLLPETTGFRIDYTGTEQKGRYIRYRCIEPSEPGKKPAHTAFRDFKINAPASPMITGDLTQIKQLPLEINDQGIGIKQLLEVVPIAKDQIFGLSIPASAKIAEVEVDLKTPDMQWATLQITEDGKTWETVSLKKQENHFIADINKRIKGVQIANTSGEAKDVYLNRFRLKYPENDISKELVKLFDEDLTTRASLSLAEEPIIENPFLDASGVVILTEGEETEVYAQGADGKWVKAGATGGNMNRISTVNFDTVKKPVKAIKFKGTPRGDITISEIIWKK